MHRKEELATKRIPVSKSVWENLHRLRKPGQTFGDAIAEMMAELKALELAEG